MRKLLLIIDPQIDFITGTLPVPGDVCVAATIRDGITIFGKKIFNVLTRYTASIDGGKTLDSLISNYDLSCDR